MRKLKRIIYRMILLILAVTQMSTVLPVTSFAKKDEEKQHKDYKVEKKIPESYAARKNTEIIVKLKDTKKSAEVLTSVKGKLKLKKLETKKKFKRQKIELLEVNEDSNLDEIIWELQNDPDVEYAQPNYLLETAAVPSDENLLKQWALLNNGQEIEGKEARSGVDINAVQAWDITQGDSSVVIGILDTGIDINHHELSGSIYINPNEIADNGIDDDGNGYIDDVYGWDFANDDASVYDSAELDLHGTYVAGIIAAKHNNGGIAGIAPNIKIMPLKFINGTTGYTCDAIEAIEYAMAMGIKIINCSFGGTDDNLALKDAMQNSGILFICAAGNRGGNSDDFPVYPASFDLPNIISVASVDTMGVLAGFSNFGSKIDVVAPGTNILSTSPDNGYDYYSGTSSSAAIVTGIAALLKSSLPTISIEDIKARICNNVRPCAALQYMVSSGGRVDAFGALTNTQQPLDEYNGPGAGDDLLLSDGEGDEDTWYTQDQLARIKERLHYGEAGINPASGNYSFTCIDMSLSAPGFQVNISRTYNSRNEKIKPMGRGWSFGFEGSATGTDLVEVILPDGSCHRFRKDGSYYKPEDTRAAFVRNSDGTSVLTTKDQYSYGFNSKGLLSWMKDRNGNTIYINHDSEGKIISIVDTVGRKFTVNYNSRGLIESIKDPLNRQVRYEYDNNNRLVRVIDPVNGTMNYGYDSEGYLNSIKDHYLNTIISLTYSHKSGDALHKVTEVTDAFGNKYSYSYDMTNRKTTITDINQRKWTYWFDTSFYTVKVQDPEGRYEITEYYHTNGKNVFGDVKTRIDRNGNTTRYEIDSRGNVTRIINPDGSFRLFEYDEKNNLISEVDEAGRKTYYIYDSDKINLIKKVQPLNGTDEYVEGVSNTENFSIHTYSYYTKSEAQTLFGCNVAGLLRSTVNPEGNMTEYTYTEYGDIKTVKDPEGNITTYEYNAIGWKTAEISPKGYRTEYEYDNNGLLIRTRLNGGETTRIVYDAAGQKIQEILPNQYDPELDIDVTTYNGDYGTRYTYYPSGKLKTVTDAAGNTTHYTYDVYGNLVSEKMPDGSMNIYTYDIMNRIQRHYFKESETSPQILLYEYSYGILDDGKTQETQIRYLNDTEKAVSVTVYDYAGRIVEKQNPDGTKTKTFYNPDGTVNETIAANGAITKYQYDGMGRLSEQWSPVSISDGDTFYSYTKYKYDKAGNKIQESSGKGLVLLNNLPAIYVTKYYSYTPGGKLESITDADGRKTDMYYDADGNVKRKETYTSLTDKVIEEFEYNHLGKIAEQKLYVRKGDLAGNDYDDSDYAVLTTTYTYDKNGNLITMKTPDGVVTSYCYDVLDRKIKTSQPGKDEYGNDVTIETYTTYDWRGNVLTNTDALGRTTVYVYNKRGFLEKMNDPMQGITAWYYDLGGRKIAEVLPANYDENKPLEQMERTEYVYDLMDRVKAKILKYQEETYNPARKEWDSNWVEVVIRAYKYDSLGNVVKELDALGYEAGQGSSLDEKISSGYGTEYTYNLAGQMETTLDPVAKDNGLAYSLRKQYDGLGRVVSETNANGVETTYTYDNQGNILRIAVNGQVIRSMTYDLAGRQTSVTDGNGNTTYYQYNAFNKVSKEILPGDSTIPANTIIYQYDVSGNLAWQQDSMGRTNICTYDNQNRLLTQTEQKADGTDSIQISIKYDKAGNKRFETDGNGTVVETVYDDLNRPVATKVTVGGVPKITSYSYDANGNLTAVTDWKGNTSSYVYDGINRLIEKKDACDVSFEKLEYNHNNVQVKAYDAYDNVTYFEYDKNNRLISTTDPEGHTSSQQYDNVGNVVTKTDGRGYATTYTYDFLNRLVSITNARGEVTSYTYDLNGNMLSQTDGKGNTTTYVYNVANKLVKRIDPNGAGDPSRTETYTYYADGNLKTKTDRNGKTTIYIYDIHGRMLSEAIGSDMISYTYDKNGNLLTMKDSTGTTVRTYDEENRVVTKTVPGFGTMTFAYDITEGYPEGYHAEVSTDPKGNITIKVYDKAGRLSSVTAEGKTTAYAYDDNGNRKKVVYPDGSSEEYTYYRDNLVKTLVNKKADGSIIDSYAYEYDAAHNQTKKTDKKGAATYTYDALNRLSKVSEPSGKTTTYTYDKAGNRILETITYGGKNIYTSYVYNEQNRLLSTETRYDSTTETVSYVYDNNGESCQEFCV